MCAYSTEIRCASFSMITPASNKHGSPNMKATSEFYKKKHYSASCIDHGKDMVNNMGKEGARRSDT